MLGSSRVDRVDPRRPAGRRWAPLVAGLALLPALTGLGPLAAHAAASASPGQVHALTPARLVDTRIGLGGIPRLGPRQAVDIPVGGHAGVPRGAAGAVLQVTVANGGAVGWLGVVPAGTATPPGVSTVNWAPGQAVTNLTVVPLAGGAVRAYNDAGTVELIVDVMGWVSAAGAGDGSGGMRPLYPARILDTRSGIGGVSGRLGPGQTLTVPVAGHGNVPAAGAAAAVLNLTVTNSDAWSYLTVYPHGATRPNTSNLNFDAGETRAGRAIAGLGGGAVDVYNAFGSTDLVVDVSGWVSDAGGASAGGGDLTLVAPTRIMDTRTGAGQAAPGRPASLQVAGIAGVPAGGVAAVLVNLTAVGATGWGYLAAFASGDALPLASDLNFAGTGAVPNLAVLPVGADGRANLFPSLASADLLVDLVGWFGAAPAAGPPPGAPVITSADAVVPDRIALVWQPPAGTAGQLAGYTIGVSPGGLQWPVDPGHVSATLTGLACGATYTVTVRASNGAGSGPASAASPAVQLVCPAPPPPTSRSLAVPYYHQQHSLDCEAAALQMALAYRGVSTSQDAILGAMGTDARRPYWDSSGLRWGDPYVAFVGDVNGYEGAGYGASSGYGVYFPPVVAAAQAFGGAVAAAGENVPADQVYQAVLDGHPAVVWVAFNWSPHATGSYLAFDGRRVMYGAPYEHAVTVIGVTPDSVEINNPEYGHEWVSRSTFEASYAMFDRMAVIL
jgi:uncharacterized protein YvpB